MDISEVARMGAEARNAAMTPEQRSQAARKAVSKRWRDYFRVNPEKRRKAKTPRSTGTREPVQKQE